MSSSSGNPDVLTHGNEKVCKQRVPSGIVLIAGAVIKLSFMLAGWIMSTTIPAPLDPYALVYFTISNVIGAFLAGLVDGFLLRDQRRGALLGFASAAIGTVFVAIAMGSGFPFPPGPLFFIGYLVFDTLALIGGLIGFSISAKMLKIAVLLAVLAVASLTVTDLIFAPTRHSGDLILKANETMTINRVYQQEGNIVVKDNATLVIRNAELVIYQPIREYSIEIRDNASLTADNARFTVYTSYVGFLLYPDSTIYVEDNATALFSHSDVVSVSVNASQSSRVTVIDCQFYYGSILGSDTSTISVLDSDTRSISCQGFSSVTAKKSGAMWYACSGSSSLLVEDTRNTGIIDCYSNATVTVNNSTLYGVSADAFLGKICFSSSLINEQIYVDNTSDFYFCGNVTINGGIADFKGQMTRNYVVVTSSKKQLNVSDTDTGKTLWNGTSDDLGYANFDLVFTEGNYTDQLLINGQDFNSTSTTPLRVN